MIAQPIEQIATVELTRRRFTTVTEYTRMAEVGVLGETDRVELIWGEIIEMSPINVAHASAVDRIVYLLSRVLGEKASLRVQSPLQLSNKSLPQPGITVLRLRDDFYSKRHPGPDDVLLLIEVADSSLSYDQKTKSTLYAAAGIADYWIVNLPERQIEVYREPRASGYRTMTRYSPGDTLSPLAFPDVTLDAGNVLGE